MIESRQAKNPGEFKTQTNRAKNTVFVTPELMVGTLEKGFEIIMSASTPADRAALAMFVVAEVHPFTDRNGRTARLAMKFFLTHAGLTRIIIPTVYRNTHSAMYYDRVGRRMCGDDKLAQNRACDECSTPPTKSFSAASRS